MSVDLDDLEELIGPNEWKPPRRRAFRGIGMRPTGDHPTHCRRGHELTADNTWVHNGSRQCKKCARLRILCREDS